MKILFHLTSPPPAIAGTDAAFQEVAALQRRFGGDTINLFPLAGPSRWLPRQLYGLHRFRELRRLDGTVDLHHVHHAQLSVFPVLRRLKKPIVYSVVAGLRDQAVPAALSSIHTVVVSNPRDEAILAAWGAQRVRMIRPGIDLTRFSRAPVPRGGAFTLLAASAPWVPEQFRQKGIDALLEAARTIGNLKLVLLWRGLLHGRLQARIAAAGLGSRVEVVNEQVDVNRMLGRCHAAVVLAANAKLVKAWPHSLLEALAAARPVLLSDTIPMADYVRERDCGVVVAGAGADEVRHGIRQLIEGYDRFQAATLGCGRDFDEARMVREFAEVYRQFGEV